jgi:hypothetical protein
MERYDWAHARQGFWAGKVRIGEPERRRLLDADLVEAFPDSQSVNDALRRIVESAKPARAKRGRRAA